MKKSRLLRIAISIDQFLAVLFLNTSEDETISSYVGRRYPSSWAERVLDGIFGAGHCKRSIEYDEIN